MVAFILSSKIPFSVVHKQVVFFSVGKTCMTAKQDVKVCFKIIVNFVY